MSTLIIGPTCAGKSTLISSGRLAHFDIPGFSAAAPVVFAKRLKERESPDCATIHYNLLYGTAAAASDPNVNWSEWRPTDERLFSALISSDRIRGAVVVVAPIGELSDRARRRTVTELTDASPGTFDRTFWLSILDQVDLFAITEALFDSLAAAAIPTTVLFSSVELPDMFARSDRVFAHHNLRGRYISLPDQAEVEAAIATPGSEYQSVTLPGNHSTRRVGLRHVGGSRQATFDLSRKQPMIGRSVLDIGCANGDMLFRAERYGAARVCGIEINPNRFSAAVRVGSLLRSEAKFRHGDFMKLDIAEQFDDVLALNVLHHIAEPLSFLEKACALARQRLVLEFPTLADRKFQANAAVPPALNEYPLIGVSTIESKQTFVYSPAAVKRLVARIGGFHLALQSASPLEQREILIFQRT
jgi:SAM-dependent methyltransferase